MDITLPVHPAALAPEQLLAQCQTKPSRASGPGGQHRNKVQTAIELVHNPTGIIGQANERRSQKENRAVALFRLRLQLAIQQRGYFSSANSPSSLWQSRCRQGRIAVNPHHRDYPAILAEALDILSAMKFDPCPAADLLGVTTSQLIKLIARHPPAMTYVNAQRQARGSHRIHG